MSERLHARGDLHPRSLIQVLVLALLKRPLILYLLELVLVLVRLPVRHERRFLLLLRHDSSTLPRRVFLEPL